MYKSIIRPILFLFSPETIHSFVFFALKIFQFCPLPRFIFKKTFIVEDKSLEREVFGLKFKNPIGMAAGLDKDAEVYDMFSYMGFSHIEVGTVTPKAQPGNPQPRLFRLKADSALINRMGFNNRGVEEMIVNLRKKKSDIIIGGNIGKNKLTPNEDATSDYEIGFNSLYPYVDYFVVNVSSPNTPNLRELQEKEPLTKLLSRLQELNNKKDKIKPILLKIAPDLTNSQLDDIIDIVKDTKIAGLVATNTTIERSNLSYSEEHVNSIGNGGLSGKPLKERSTEVIKYIVEKSNNAFPVIGVGGIMTPEDAIEKLEAGASLIQIYTGFIYNGPGFAKQVNKKLMKINKK